MSAVALNSQLPANLAPGVTPGQAGGSAKAGEAFGSVLFGLSHAHGHAAASAAGSSAATPDSRLSAKSSGKNKEDSGTAGSGEAFPGESAPTSHDDAVLAALGLTNSFAPTGAASAAAAATAAAASSTPTGPSAMQLIHPDALPRYASDDAAAATADASQWDLSGATPLKSLLASDSSLGLSGFQVRTHLAATGSLTPSALADANALTSITSPAAAGPGLPGLKDLGAQAANFAALGLSAGSRGSQVAASQLAGAKAAVSAAGDSANPAWAPLAANAGLAPSASVSTPATSTPTNRRGVAAAGTATGEARAFRADMSAPGGALDSSSAAPLGSATAGSGGRNSGMGYGSGGKNAAAAAIAATADTGPAQGVAASTDASLAGGPAPAAFGPVSLDQAVDIIAEQANGLGSPAAASASAATATSPAVKELEITLNPQDLGSISVKLRLSNGKLSVVIGVSNAKTLSSLEGDRQQIVDRLTASAPSLQGLTLQPQGAGDSGANANSSGGQQDASDLYGSGRGQGQADSAQTQAQGGGSGSPAQSGGREDGRAGASAPTPSAQPQSSGLGLSAGDLVV